MLLAEPAKGCAEGRAGLAYEHGNDRLSMQIVVNGGGPSGLYFALLARKRLGARVTVYEQNPRGATYGFGIVLAERGLNRLLAADAESYRMLMDACYVSRHRVLALNGERIFIDGGGYGGAIARLRLLEILEDCCERAGVEIRYETRMNGGEFDGADLIVGADGVNSAVRRAQDEAFGTTTHVLTNKLAWYGTRAHFPYPILSFRKTELGQFWCVGYAYSETMGTFVAECDAETWETSLSGMSDDERTSIAEGIFAEELDGKPLISNRSIWASLPVIRVRNWNVENRVLIGDALHSAHPSIGSGTRIAMEDSIALCSALEDAGGDFARGLALFREQREPAKNKLVAAAEASIDWYEHIHTRIGGMTAPQLVFDYMMRTGRVGDERLREEYPYFMERYAREWAEFQQAPERWPRGAVPGERGDAVVSPMK
ncbi:FAD-dependent monooxygenase [Sphingobium sp.]|uniref:FAD-dependent monooxygenase n=1 Tax=Sphingobium sp. TaxID=1912891 RepID=UPI0028BE23BA|nr:FAD-dependent monooxygenase [Sphingobium sp.]